MECNIAFLRERRRGAFHVQPQFLPDEMIMKSVKVTPVYGFGWREADSSIDPPKPFRIRMHKYQFADDKAHYAKLLGKVSSLMHRYRGKWVLLSMRTKGNSPSYGLRIYDKKPALSATLDEAEVVTFVASGFAELR